MSTYPTTVSEFNALTSALQETERFKQPLMFGLGRELRTKTHSMLASVRYGALSGPGKNLGTASLLMKVCDIEPTGVQNAVLDNTRVRELLKYFQPFFGDGKQHANIAFLNEVLQRAADSDREKFVATFIFDNVAPVAVHDSTLRLYGLSHRFFKPNTISVEKIFTKFPNVSWQDDVPYDEDDVEKAIFKASYSSIETYSPYMVDKFPLYIHRINALKMGVRITDQNKVRLGAYLGEGTTLMPGASYVNFNAGTEGASMVEGRISSSAFVGAGSDVGGGASILGTLSGGNSVPISIGRNCLLEVNSSLGIPIGDAVIIGAETAVMASSRIRVGIDGHRHYGQFVKASELAGISAATFRRNDEDGVLEVVRTRRNVEFAQKLEDGESILNADLHTHN